MGDGTANMPCGRGSGKTREQRRPWSGRSAAGRGEARHYAALDLGTNNCRLLIARPQGSGFAVVDAFSRIVRLGEGLATSGKLSDAAIERTIAALRICAEKLEAPSRRSSPARWRPKPVARPRTAPSSSSASIARPASRSTSSLPRKRRGSPCWGCHALLEPGDGPALVFDIGGGSTELVLVDLRGEAPRILDWHSAPWGSCR